MSFELIEPESLSDAVSWLDPGDPGVRPVAGGTMLMLMLKSGFFRPTRLVSLRRVGEGLAGIRATPEGGLAIGAMTRLRALERSAEIGRVAPVIAETLLTHSNVRVRNVATIGGNLAHGDPHMDLPPVLVALGAEVIAIGPEGRRRIAVEDLCTGYLETALAGNELIEKVIVPAQVRRHSVYVKCTTRAADDWPALGVAVSVEADGGAIRDARIVVGAATDRPTRLCAAEGLLRGATPREALLREAGRVAAGEAEIVADPRGSAAYKRRLVEVHVARALCQALGLPR